MRRLGRVVIRHRPPVMDKRKLQKIERAEIMNNNFQKTSELKLTDREAKLLAIRRKMDFGEVRVVVTDGIPTRVEEIKKSIKL